MTVPKIDYTKYLNYSAVALAFSIPVSRAGIVLFSFTTILLWILEGNFKEKIELIKNNTILKTLFYLVLFYFISLLWSDNFFHGFRYSIKFWYFIPIVVIFTSVKKEYLQYMISAFLIAMLISEIISYGIFFEWWHFKGRSPSYPTPFMNHLQYSMFLAFTALLILNRVFNQIKWSYKVFYIVYFLIVTSNLFINGGRTGQMAFIFSIFIVGFLNIKNKIKAFFLMLILISSILYVGYQTSPNFNQRVNKMLVEITNTFEKKQFCTSVGIRFAFWIVSSDVIKDNPLIGVGVSDTIPTMHKYIDTYHTDKLCVKNLPNAHNDFVQVFVQIGLIGVLLYIYLFYKIYNIKIKSKDYQNLPIIFVSVYIISSMFENMIHQQFSMMLLTLFIGIFLAAEKFENKNKD